MRISLFSILFLVIGFLSSHAQTGVWNGELDIQGMKLPLVFHLEDSAPKLDSPAQGVKGIPVELSRFPGDSIVVRIPALGVNFSGRYTDGVIVGVFSQRGYDFPLTLTPGERIVRRPQTPHPPFPYSQEEVTFANGEALLKGTLTLPEGYNRETPVVIMVTGSGLQNRDEELFEHKPFAVIADALARNGIASLRYDDRGFGESTGDVVNVTTTDLMNDALAGIELLRERFSHVGIIGHSEGGTIALMIGADKKADFIVSLAGMVVSGRELLLLQNRYLLAQAGYSQEVSDEYCALLSLAFDMDDSLNQKLDTSNLPKELADNLRTSTMQVKSPYFQHFLALDPGKILGGITCPVLALNGMKDTQVFFEGNIGALKEGLPSNPLNRIIALEGLNHMFQHCTTGNLSEYAQIEETFSPDVLDEIIKWIHEVYPTGN